MSQVNSTGASAGVSSLDLGPSQSIQLMFAKLQLAMSQGCKESATASMKDMTDAQEDATKMRTDIATLKSLQNKDKSIDGNASNNAAVSAMAKKYPDLDYSDKSNDKFLIKLQARLDNNGTNSQQTMVLIQDYMGQYNSYLQGANSAIQQSNQTLQTIAKG